MTDQSTLTLIARCRWCDLGFTCDYHNDDADADDAPVDVPVNEELL